MEKNVTSEEKLLRLIKQKEKSQKSAKDKEQKADNKDPKKEEQQKPKKDLLIALNRILMITCVGLAAYLLIKQFVLKEEPMLIVDSKIGERVIPKKEQIFIAKVEPFSYYQDKFLQRDLFESPWKRGKSKDGGGLSNASDLNEKLILVGIVLDEDPKAIVEDKALKQTFFISKGEEIAGARLEEIEEGRVLFLYNDELVELTP